MASEQTGTTTIVRRGNKIVFSVDGWHTTEAAEDSARELVQLVREIREPVEFIADLRTIAGFTTQGMGFWQEAFKEARTRIKLITLVQGTPLARVTASAVGLYANIKVRSVDTLTEALNS